MPIIPRAILTELSPGSPHFPIYVAGFSVLAVVILAVVLWYAVRSCRTKARARREENQGAAFISVRGVVKDHSISKGVITGPVPVPTRPMRTAEDILDFHRESANFPQPFTPKPFSFALTASPAPTQTPIVARSSVLSAASSSHRFSVISSNSSVNSRTSGTTKKIRQIFMPILPDELSVVLGEHLTLVQSFDDGWCVVGRESPNPSPAVSAQHENIELGVIPAWCFLKPVIGLRAERPIRASSLGITVQMEDTYASRDDIISWSNF